MNRLDALQESLAAELSAYAAQQVATTRVSYGPEALAAVERLFAEVKHDPYHWCGLLTLVGYELEQGTDAAMIIQAARAMEIMHASARLLANGDTAAGQTGLHMAEITLANLEGAAESDRLKALSILNRSSLLRLNGKTAHYEFLNPMHVGMVLAGADCHSTDGITPFMQAIGAADLDAARTQITALDRWPAAILTAVLDRRQAQLAKSA